jgi:thiol:disulfide interchange protein DsbD
MNKRMKTFTTSTLAGLALLPLGFSQVAGVPNEGNAKVDLLIADTQYQAGKPIRAAVRMIYDPGYHGYWINPGEGGMKTEVKWKLPEGWTASELSFPAPQREVTGNLASYAYHGEVVLPFEFTPPANAAGEVKIEGELSWLACNDKGCVPGDAVVSATLQAGEATPNDRLTQNAKIIEQAWPKIPAKDPRWQVDLDDLNGSFIFTIHTKADDAGSLEGSEIFPIDEQIIDSAKGVLIKTSDESGKIFEATAKRSEYAPKDLTALSFVVHSAKLKRPLLLEWKKK